MVDSKTSFDFIRVQSKLNKLVDDFMLDAIRTAVRFRPSPLSKYKEVIMSKIPDTPKPKYNHNDAFRWVDSQWEKFMTEQKEHKAMIKQLQDDLSTCTENFQIQRKQMEELVARVPSQYLTGDK